MAITYFGQCTSGGDTDGDSWDNNGSATTFQGFVNKSFSCPGSGTQVIKDLSVYAKASDSTRQVRLGVYTTGGSLVVETPSTYAITSTTGAWIGYSGTGLATTLTGGVSYRLAFATNSLYQEWYYKSGGSSGDVEYSTYDYMSGLPSSWPTSGMAAWTGWWNIRCGVEPSSTATLEQEGFRFRNDDGSESAATWKNSQDVNINLSADTAARLRVLINATGDPTGRQFQLEYRHKPSGGSFGLWKKAINPQ